MYNRRKHTLKSLVKDFMDSENVKTVIGLLILQLMLLLFGVYKGVGPVFLPVSLILMFFSIWACVTVFYFEADRLILLPVLILMDTGFLVQILQSPDTFSNLGDFLLKLLLALLAAILVAIGYSRFAAFISTELFTKCIMVLQVIISVIMLLMPEKNGAKISFGGITLFEIVKVMYIFVAVSLLCKPELETMTLCKIFKVKRELVLFLHTCLLSVLLVLCSEMGTLLVLYLTGIALAFLYSKYRGIVCMLIGSTFLGLAGVWILANILCHKLLAGNLALPGVVEKVLTRFAVALHPEQYYVDGYQQVAALQAMAAGGSFGLDAERGRIPIPFGDTDFVISSCFQTCGFFITVFMVLAFVVLYLRNHQIATFCKDTYFKGLVEGIGTLLSIEVLIHIAYNNSIFPVTGIPCYFLSRSVTALLTGIVLVTIVLVISTGDVEREVE